MKKLISFFLLLTCHLIAFEGSYVPRRHLNQHFLVSAKVSGFRPDSEILREIFDDYWVNYQIEFDTLFYKCYRLWGAINFMHNSGRSIGGNDKTSIRIIPLTLGFDYIYMFNRHCEVYAGAGVRYFFLDVHNHPPHKKKNAPKLSHTHPRHMPRVNKENGFGGALRVGAIINITNSIAGDLFFDYSLKKFDFSHSSTKHAIDLSGLSIGLGLGYRF